MQDAVNLGWKLAQVVKGVSGEDLLDTYHAERHPAGARALRYTAAQSILQRPDPRIPALNEAIGDLLGFEGPRTLMAGRISGLDVAYDLGEGHPLLGRRVPDLDLETADGTTRVYSLLHRARPVLLDLGDPADLDIGPWAERVTYVDATYRGPWDLPVLGTVSAPTGVLVRPDGHVAWVGEGSSEGLQEALTTWCGP